VVSISKEKGNLHQIKIALFNVLEREVFLQTIKNTCNGMALCKQMPVQRAFAHANFSGNVFRTPFALRDKINSNLVNARDQRGSFRSAFLVSFLAQVFEYFEKLVIGCLDGKRKVIAIKDNPVVVLLEFHWTLKDGFVFLLASIPGMDEVNFLRLEWPTQEGLVGDHYLTGASFYQLSVVLKSRNSRQIFDDGVLVIDGKLNFPSLCYSMKVPLKVPDGITRHCQRKVYYLACVPN
jgi:hypothetical protein